MFRKLLLLLVLCASFSASASHTLGGYLNYEVSNQGRRLDFELHLYRLDNNTLWYNDFFLIRGPQDIRVNKVDSVRHLLSDSLCGSNYYWEYIYKGGNSINFHVPAGGVRYDFQMNCCESASVNMNDTATTLRHYFYVDIIGREVKNASTGTYRFRDISFMGASLNLSANAAADVNTTIDWSIPAIPSQIDSVKYRLAPLYESVGLPRLYKQGYSGLTPLPDQSEDSLNLPNTFNPNNGRFNFRARSISTTPGLYFVAIEYDVYLDSTLMGTVNSISAVELSGGDSTLIQSLRMEAAHPDTNFALMADQQVTVDLKYGDSLYYELSAYSNLGLKLYAADLIGKPDTTGMRQNLVQPILRKPNGNGALDTNTVYLQWNPIPNDYNFRPGVYPLTVRFAGDSCGSRFIEAHFKVRLIRVPRFSIRDTLQACFGQQVDLRAYFTDSTYRINPLFGIDYLGGTRYQLAALRSGYIYLEDSLGIRVDSLYLEVGAPPANQPITTDFGLYRIFFSNPTGTNLQTWTLNKQFKVTGGANDSVEIIGPGYYAGLRYDPISGCAEPSDTLEVEHDFLWGANYDVNASGAVNLVRTRGVQNAYFIQTISLKQGVREIESIFIQGLNNISPANQNIRVELEPSNGSQQASSGVVVQGSSYVRFDHALTLTATDSVELRLRLGPDIELDFIEGDGSPVKVNGLRFSNFRFDDRNVSGPIPTITNRFPIGIRFKGTIGLEELKPEDRLSVFPSPTQDVLNLNGKDLQGKSWTLTSPNGTKLLQGQFESDEATLSIAHLPKGLYLLTVDGQVLKVVKE